MFNLNIKVKSKHIPFMCIHVGKQLWTNNYQREGTAAVKQYSEHGNMIAWIKLMIVQIFCQEAVDYIAWSQT